jgi:hypothetical protein
VTSPMGALKCAIPTVPKRPARTAASDARQRKARRGNLLRPARRSFLVVRLRREYALVDRAGLLNKPGSFEVTLRDKLYNFAHLALQGWKFGGKDSASDNKLVLDLPRRKSCADHKKLFPDGRAAVKIPSPQATESKPNFSRRYWRLRPRRADILDHPHPAPPRTRSRPPAAINT